MVWLKVQGKLINSDQVFYIDTFDDCIDKKYYIRIATNDKFHTLFFYENEKDRDHIFLQLSTDLMY